MVKIKQKKTMNLPQLIEWGWGNPSLSRNKRFFSKDENLGITKHCVHFNDFGYPEVDNRYCLEPADTFTVEVEEEITEDTKFKHLIEIEQDDTCYMWLNTSVSAEKQVNDCKNLSKEFHAYIDGEFKLIWTREKGLVE
ncbi:hypothetical protein BUY18_02065 [Staphylococcus cohnii]|nr:hypothetical protein BUY18_02065 [Staphylococcus cohnii]